MSPSPAIQEFDFPALVDKLIIGQKARRQAWEDPETVIFVNGFLKIRKEGIVHDLILAEADLTATDWVVVREQ